jgi:hypothetical protein
MWALMPVIAGTAGVGTGPNPLSPLPASVTYEERKLTASDAAPFDHFGDSVAVSCDTVVVGATAGDGVGADSGAAYVFERDHGGAGTWGQVQKLTASDGVTGDRFGCAVAISGDTAVVGAHGKTDAGLESGAAYIFERNQGGPDMWGEVLRLNASLASYDKFGFSVAISGGMVVVGAYGDGTYGIDSGAAYLFARDQGGPDMWGLVKKLFGSDTTGNDGFGFFVAISGDTIVVGAPFADIGGINLGAAYVFECDQGGAGMWGEVKKLTASDPGGINDYFGISVAISGDAVAVGASGYGAAYIFERNQGGINMWGEMKKLTAYDSDEVDVFGSSVAINDEDTVVGRYDDDHAGSFSGSAYHFRRDEGGAGMWGKVDKLIASDAAGGDSYGRAVAIAGEVALIGAAGADTDTGAAYLHRVLLFADGFDSGDTSAWSTAAESLLFGDRFGTSSVPIGTEIAPDRLTAWIDHANADQITVVDLETWRLESRFRQDELHP